MSFTRFHDDPARIRRELEQSTNTGRYQLNVPGNGINMPFQEDPQLRLQHWGANLRTQTIAIENDLRCMTRPLNRDLLGENNYKTVEPFTTAILYPSTNPFIEESRATHPAWMYRDLEHSRWENPIINPQALSAIEPVFPRNIQTRILEKDYFVPKIPVVSNVERTDFYFSPLSR
jgi:hypothetical protein